MKGRCPVCGNFGELPDTLQEQSKLGEEQYQRRKEILALNRAGVSQKRIAMQEGISPQGVACLIKRALRDEERDSN